MEIQFTGKKNNRSIYFSIHFEVDFGLKNANGLSDVIVDYKQIIETFFFTLCL
jgi:hypothetical protein